MTSITVTTSNLQYVHLFEHLAKTLNLTFNKVEQDTLSKSMQKALEEEEKGQITKLINHKNAVAEIIK
ncbi:MAG: hypothetical protein LBU83_05485 [Bacteroidales bacterium]|jgi:hypothetical protein|nr:hypothetical protein [Bacteroidales bacterium]